MVVRYRLHYNVILNKENADIRDKNGNDVRLNYAITLEPGYVRILPRKIKVSVPHANKTFDNRALEFDHTVTVGGEHGLVPGHTGNMVWTNDVIINVDDEPLYAYHVYDSSHNEVTSNYQISYDVELNVTRRLVVVKSYDQDIIYDGTEHSALNGTYTVTSGQEVNGTTNPLGTTSTFPSYFTLTFTISGLSGTNVGFYKFGQNITGLSIHDNELDSSVNPNNFLFSYLDTGLHILKRDITVASPTIECEYTGYIIDNNLDVRYGSLVSGHELEYDDYLMVVRDITDTTNEFDVNLVRIMDGTDDVTDNYNISAIFGTVRIY